MGVGRGKHKTTGASRPGQRRGLERPGRRWPAGVDAGVRMGAGEGLPKPQWPVDRSDRGMGTRQVLRLVEWRQCG